MTIMCNAAPDNGTKPLVASDSEGIDLLKGPLPNSAAVVIDRKAELRCGLQAAQFLAAAISVPVGIVPLLEGAEAANINRSAYVNTPTLLENKVLEAYALARIGRLPMFGPEGSERFIEDDNLNHPLSISYKLAITCAPAEQEQILERLAKVPGVLIDNGHRRAWREQGFDLDERAVVPESFPLAELHPARSEIFSSGADGKEKFQDFYKVCILTPVNKD